MAIEQIYLKKNVAIISYDIDNDETRRLLHDYLVNDLSAHEDTESTYWFFFNDIKIVCNHIENILTTKKDNVYIWNHVIRENEPYIQETHITKKV